MRRDEQNRLLLSPSDLVTYLECPCATLFDVQQVFSPADLPKETDESSELLKQKGLQHEYDYLEHLRQLGCSIAEIPQDTSTTRRVALTKEALASGVDVIYQAAFLRDPWNGFADFLLRTEKPSKLGNFSYEVADTKLALHAKPEYVVQLYVYSDLLAEEQGLYPRDLHVVLGNKSKVTLRVSDFQYYQGLAGQRFLDFIKQKYMPRTGEPCSRCSKCRWAFRCEEEWERSEHLRMVANIQGSQIKKLRRAGINSMRELANLSVDQAIPKLQPDALTRLREQARLQIAKRDDGQDKCEILPLQANKGFARLPRPNDGDLFFDMEGDPHYGNPRLEYLFGFVLLNEKREPEFKAFWAHDRQEEKKAFEAVMDFIMARLAAYPDAYIYHYAAYEETALKNLAMYHGTREAEVDFLLRNRKLVDLYKVVREAVRVSEPRYSIKNMETFYAEKRAGEVKTAGDSIVMYEKWRALGDDAILREISDYNEFDCRSTLMCRDWLLRLRPSDVDWFSPNSDEPENPEKDAARQEAEARTAQLIAKLQEGVPETEKPWRELVGHLLEFHRRESKPGWWALFTRLDMSDEEMVEDAECIGKCTLDKSITPYKLSPRDRSLVYEFEFPAQDFKMGVGTDPISSLTGKRFGTIVGLDDKARRIALKISNKQTDLPDCLSLIPPGPLEDKVLRGAILRYAEAVANGNQGQYPAVTSILRKELPHINGCQHGDPIIKPGDDPTLAAVSAVARLDNSHILIQGPPGTGKTYTSSHAIVELLKQGKRVGVASNSHKAINNLLAAVEKRAVEQNIHFRGVKKCSGEDHAIDSKGFIQNTEKNEEAESEAYNLVAGTAWLFSRPAFDQVLDYLFIDEAGQVSIANIVAMGTSARNIVLVGDQMQLSQPIQGIHPGSSGLSALEYLLGEAATVPPEQGIFLATTRRMHPAICHFISDAVYDGRLQPDLDNARRHIVADGNRDPDAIISAGLRFVEVEHEGCSQKSEEEAERLKHTYESLLGMTWVDEVGDKHELGIEDILVVTPYNMQVDLLEKTLPEGARVGTVDRFQGQEAPVVLISMVTSSAEELPRNIEFLFSRNRLNVAISRARCLAVIYANPRLLEISCNTIDQMRLVNTLCWAKAYADRSAYVNGMEKEAVA